MEPVNNKSLLAFLFNQMERLDKKEISIEQAGAQAKLAAQANNLLNYELKRAEMEMRIAAFKHSADISNIRLREIESKGFDDKLL